MPCGGSGIGLARHGRVRESDRQLRRAALAHGRPAAREMPQEPEVTGMPTSFANQVAVITGASSGIGWALARALAAEGCKVGLVARRKEQLAALAGGTAAAAPADVGDRTQVQAAVKDLATQLGPVDLLVANAGVGMPTLLDPVNIGDVEQMIRI